MGLDAKIHPRNDGEKGKYLVVLIHGLGAPETWEGQWSSLLLSDPALPNLDVAVCKYDTAHVASGWLSTMGITQIKTGLFSRVSVGMGPFSDIQTLAHELRTFLQSNAACSYEHVIIVGHSMGGLIGIRYILESTKHKEKTRVRGFISLATPFNGANKAFYHTLIKSIHNHAQIPNLEPNSTFLDDTIRLWQEQKNNLNIYTAFCYGANDQWVPKESAIPHVVSSKWLGSSALSGDHSSFLDIENCQAQAYVVVSENIQKAIAKSCELRHKIIAEAENKSQSRCIARWQSTGLTLQAAKELSEKAACDISTIEPSSEKPLVLLIGEFGAGKSFASELLFQKWLLQAREDAQNPIPIYLQASPNIGTLQEHITKIKINHEEDNEKGFYIIVDGMDEVGASIASQLLDEARVIVQAWPKSRIVMTSRPLPTFAAIEEARPAPKLTAEEAYHLISLIAGKAIDTSYRYSWPPAVQDAISRPFFSIILGLYLRENNMLSPKSKGDLLNYLIGKAIEKCGIDNEATKRLLMRLAVLSTDRGNIPVNSTEFRNSGDAIAQIMKSGLIIQSDQQVSFALPIISQWFAAEALAAGMKNVAEFQTDLKSMDYWRYPFIILISFFAHEKVEVSFSVIVENNPALAAGIVKEGIGTWGIDGDTVAPAWLESGKRIRKTMTSWVKGIGNSANFIAPVNENGVLQPLGIHVGHGDITTSWHYGEQNKSEIYELFQDDSKAYGNITTTHAGRYSTWAWQRTLGELKCNLANLLEERALYVESSPIAIEQSWALFLELTGKSSPCCDFLLIDDVKKLLTGRYAGGSLIKIGNRKYDSGSIWRHIRTLEEKGLDRIIQPWPGPDVIFETGCCVWDLFTDQRLLERTSVIYQQSIEAYIQLVDTFFPALKNRLQTYNVFPAILKGQLVISKIKGMQGHPRLEWYLDPLPLNQKNRVDIELCEESTLPLMDRGELSAGYDKLRRMRTECAEWIGYQSIGQLLDNFQPDPVTETVYGWLWDDLKRISWVDGLLSRRH